MFAAHFAAGLALKTQTPKTPAWILITAAFLPDFLWIVLAGLGVEPAAPDVFFDGWSHSLLSILVQATAFALLFRGRERIIIWCAVASHFVLDFLIHPRPLQLFPHSSIDLGWDLWAWGHERTMGATHYWLAQISITCVLLGIYTARAKSVSVPANLAAASILLIVGLSLIF
jgi:hypothetical protein